MLTHAAAHACRRTWGRVATRFLVHKLIPGEQIYAHPCGCSCVQAYPGHCDCLALANIQASLLNIADANPLHHCDGYPDVKPRLSDTHASSSGDKSDTIPVLF